MTFNTVSLKHSIASRLFRVVFGIYFLVTLVVTAMQLVTEYRHTRAAILEEIQTLPMTLSSGLANSLWMFNYKLAESILAGVQQIPIVSGATIESDAGKRIMVGAASDTDLANVYSKEDAGKSVSEMALFSGLFGYQFPIMYLDENGDAHKVGTGTLYSDNQVVFQRVRFGFFLIIVSALVKTAALWLIFFLVIRHYLGKPLHQLTEKVAQINPNKLESSCCDGFKVSNDKPLDEIGILSNRFHHLVTGLIDAKVALQEQSQEILQLEVAGRWQAEQRSREVETQFQALTELSPIAVFMTDRNGCLQYVNQKWSDLSGIPVQSASGEHWLAQVAPEDKSLLEDLWAKLLESHENLQGEYRLNSSGGTLVWVYGMMKPLFESGGLLKGFMGILVDISDRKALESQLLQAQKMEAIGILAGGIAHEFNNLLTIIQGYAELLSAGVDNSEGKGYLETIQTSVGRGAALVRQILAFSRKTEQSQVVQNIVPVIQESLALIRATTPANVNVNQNYDVDYLPVKVDVSQLNQVILNLCNNAFQAMEGIEGSALTVCLNRISGAELKRYFPECFDGEYMVLTISDTGRGISSDAVSEVFDPFFTTKEVGVGTGLGLSVVYGIITQHEGFIRLETEENIGTSFFVYLPVAQESPQDKTVVSTQVVSGDGRIMVVDDETDLTELYQDILSEIGFQVSVFNSSTEALTRFKESPDEFDLVYSDVSMPDMTGDQLAEALLKIRPDLPILLATGFSESFTEQDARRLGVRQILAKPTPPRELCRIIQEIIDQNTQDKN